jgi:hypothetical protein
VPHLEAVKTRPEQFLCVSEIAGMLIFPSDLKIRRTMHREKLAGKWAF